MSSGSSPISLSPPSSSPTAEVSPASSRLSESPPPYSVVSHEVHEYIYARESFTLSLGKRVWHTPVPAYGARAHIRGNVELAELPYGQIVVISLIGKLTAGFAKAPWTTEVLRLVKSVEVYDTGVDFDLRIPEFDSTGVHRLPPSVSRSQSDLRATVRYFIRVEFCGSWSIFERFEVPILYLPRTTLPVPPVLPRALPFPSPAPPSFSEAPASSQEDNKLPDIVSAEESPDWAHIPVPHSPPPPYTTLFERLQAWIHHPRPVTPVPAPKSPLEMLVPQPAEFATGQEIPFVVRARADVEPHSIQIALVAHLMVRIHGRWVARETPSGRTEVWGVAPDPHPAQDEHEDGSPHVLWGVARAGVDDVSWAVPLQASLSFALRVTAPPDWAACAPLSIRTHSWDAADLEQGRRAPAMALAPFALEAAWS